MVNNVSYSKYTNILRKSVRLPALADMRTKGQCKLSEEELVKKIADLARRDAAAGRNSMFSSSGNSSEWNKLHSDFVSFGAPDRLGIVEKKLGQLTGRSNSSRVKGYDLFCMLNNRRRRIHDPDVNVGGNRIGFKDERGEEVVCYATTVGWYSKITPAEIARSRAFLDLWNQALADAQEDLEQEAEAGITFEAWA